jgi:hypothetical protein
LRERFLNILAHGRAAERQEMHALISPQHVDHDATSGRLDDESQGVRTIFYFCCDVFSEPQWLRSTFLFFVIPSVGRRRRP